MKTALLAAALGFLAATGPLCAQTLPAPVVTGALRDQGGAPVAGAEVLGQSAEGGVVARSRSDADGTFALFGTGIARVEIRCAFCARQVRGIAEDLTIIVPRYRALFSETPSQDDIAQLPYARAESVLSLQPYSVLFESSGVLPGSYVADRALSRAGGLLVVSSIPNYDVSANVSPFEIVPFYQTGGVQINDAAGAYRYGDRADAGTFLVEPRNDRLRITTGDESALSASSGTDARVQVALSSGLSSVRSALSVLDQFPITEGSLSLNGLASRGSVHTTFGNTLQSSFSGVHFDAKKTRLATFYLDALADNGSYTALSRGLTVNSYWNDQHVRAGIRERNGTAFLEGALRRSYGEYDTSPERIPQIAATLRQVQFTAGERIAISRNATLLPTLQYEQAGYSGGPTDSEYASSTTPATTDLLAPELHLLIGDSINGLDVLAASTYRLPTFLERYAKPPVPDVVLYDRNQLLAATMRVSDRNRYRASLTAYHQDTHGLDEGSVGGIGTSISWQVSPEVSLRSWVLHYTDTTAPVQRVARFTPAGGTETVFSSWMQYRRNGLGVNVIYRRDILDTVGVSHLDGSLQFPVSAGIDAVVGTSLVRRTRSVDFSLQLR